MGDYVVRGMAADNQVRFFGAVTRDLTEEARKIHESSPVVTAALGRLLTAGAMMGAMCKNDTDLVTIQIKCNGPIGGLGVTADARARVKGYVYHPQVMLPPSSKGKLDVSGALGEGVLQVIKDLGMKEPYSGQTALVSGEIAEDLTYYFASSEQIPTSVALGVLMNRNNTVRQAGGFIVQMMPYASEEIVDTLEKRLAAFTSVTSHLDAGETPEDMIRNLFEGYDVVMEDRIPAEYYCNCSRERVEKAVISVGKKELTDMIHEGKPIEVNCHFCNTHYTFSVEDLKKMLKAAR